MENTANIFTALRSSVYAAPALMPQSPWLDKESPNPVTAKLSSNSNPGSLLLEWDLPAEGDGFLVAVYCRADNMWRYDVVPVNAQSYSIKSNIGVVDAIAVSLIDRAGNESEKRSVDLGA